MFRHRYLSGSIEAFCTRTTFEEMLRDQGLEVVVRQYANVHQTDVGPQVQRLRDANPDCALFLGMHEPTLAFGRAIREMSWDIPRFSNIAMLVVAYNPDAIEVNEGIIWTDQPRRLSRAFDVFARRWTKTRRRNGMR